jgi:RNA polymerase sigma-70 factor (ECF subfamily)
MDEEIHACLDRRQWTEAFELVVARYQDRVFRLAFSMLGDRPAAEESAQETFIRIWRGCRITEARRRFRLGCSPVARNTCLTALQAAGKRRILSLDVPEVRAAAEARESAFPRVESGPDLPLLLSQLPEKYRQALTLFYMEDRSYLEVARILDLPMGTVKTNIHRARKELADALSRAKMAKGRRVMPCAAFEDRLLDYADLSAAARETVDAHTSTCADCREYLETLASIDVELTRLLAEARPSRNLAAGSERVVRQRYRNYWILWVGRRWRASCRCWRGGGEHR